MDRPTSHQVISSVAPIRICDIGGWTDTWFAEYGRVFNIGVYPYIEVQIAIYPAEQREHRIIINAENYGERYVVDPAASNASRWDRHPLLEAAIGYMRVPDHLAFEATIYSQAPVGASTGTSAAVAVALIGALDVLTPGRMTPHEIAMAAQHIETRMLRQQCGVQDQLCSAYGGISYIDIYHYPFASVSPILIPDAIWWELERRLVLIYLGNSHVSTQVHEIVIHDLEGAGADDPRLEALRCTAPQARDALYSGDFGALGEVMIANNEAQRALNPALISPNAECVMEIAKEHGALGWKVNGAGGEGGSMTLLCGPRMEIKRELIREIEAENALFRNIPLYLSRYGLRVWQT